MNKSLLNFLFNPIELFNPNKPLPFGKNPQMKPEWDKENEDYLDNEDKM